MVIRWLMDRGSDSAQAAEFFALTDVGLKRQKNEDAVLALRLPDGRVLLAVADGVGGSEGGSAASEAAIAGLQDAIDDEPDAGAALRAAFTAAQEAVDSLSDGEQGPATTLVAALVEGDRAWIANVGDSRAYLLGEAGFRRLTEDHSWVAEQVRAGRLTPEEARGSNMRNIITRALGAGESHEPDVCGPLTLSSGETLVLTSDGLHGVVDEAAITDAVASYPPAEAARELVRLAREAGGPDNISVVIYRAG